jgi:hypothetical protein
VDIRTGKITHEWYLFLMNQFQGVFSQPGVPPGTTPVTTSPGGTSIINQITNITYAATSDIGTFTDTDAPDELMLIPGPPGPPGPSGQSVAVAAYFCMDTDVDVLSEAISIWNY